MEFKWYMIGVAVIMVAMVGAGMYSDYQKSQCKIAAIQSHMAVADIEKACN